MAYTTVVAGTTITASWANSNVRDQTIVPFATTSARDSAISAPVVGQIAYIKSNNAAEGLTAYTSGSVWRPPWNLAWGDVAISAVPAAFTFSTGQGNSSNFTWTAVQNRKYLVLCSGTFANGTVTGTIDQAWLATSGGTVLSPMLNFTAISSSMLESRLAHFNFSAASSGTQTWRFSASAAAGGNQTFTPLNVSVADVGPAGAPA